MMTKFRNEKMFCYCIKVKFSQVKKVYNSILVTDSKFCDVEGK